MTTDLWFVFCSGIVIGLLLGMMAKWIGKKIFNKT